MRVPISYNEDMEISERQKQILCQIVEEYAETASPVGSVTMAKLFNVSPATIRAEMARLEVLGLIAQPHTSAGRVPTDAGYRFYVNSLSGNANNAPVVPEPVIAPVEPNAPVVPEQPVAPVVEPQVSTPAPVANIPESITDTSVMQTQVSTPPVDTNNPNNM